MRFVVPYLRVIAGMFAAVTLWLAIVEVLNGHFGQAGFTLLFAVGLTYLAIGRPLRDRRQRVKAEQAALAARADAGHRAFLAGGIHAAMTPPPSPPEGPRLRRGVVIAGVVAAMFVLFGIINDVSDGLVSSSDIDVATTPQASVPSASALPATPTGASAATMARTVSPAPTP